jgi:predicted small integral membrane protein
MGAHFAFSGDCGSGVGAMIPRTAKIALVAGVALLYSLILFGNLADPGANYHFVRHVLAMDTTFPGNHSLWRAIRAPWIHVAFYIGILLWELANAVLVWWGAARMLRARRAPAAEFRSAIRFTQGALAFSLMLWLVAFLAVGGEWFLMWQSPAWNGQQAAARNFAVAGLVMLLIGQPEQGETA